MQNAAPSCILSEMFTALVCGAGQCSAIIMVWQEGGGRCAVPIRYFRDLKQSEAYI